MGFSIEFGALVQTPRQEAAIDGVRAVKIDDLLIGWAHEYKRGGLKFVSSVPYANLRCAQLDGITFNSLVSLTDAITQPER